MYVQTVAVYVYSKIDIYIYMMMFVSYSNTALSHEAMCCLP